MAAREPRRGERAPVAAGIELAQGSVRAVVGRREGSSLRVTGSGIAPLDRDVVTGGLITDRAAAGRALRLALEGAEDGERAQRIVIAIDADEVRSVHVATAFERRSAEERLEGPEVQRALREAREDAGRAAQQLAADDPALRGIATVQLDARGAGHLLDGRPIASLEGFHGRSVVVNTDVTLAPLLHSGATQGAAAGLGRRVTLTSGIYALARILAESGHTDTGVLRLGADVTAFAVIREGRVVATRVFGLGRDALLGREPARETDAMVWARCVLARDEALEGRLPARWALVGVPDTLGALPRTLGALLSERRGSAVEVATLAPSAVRVLSDASLQDEHLVAAGAAALAAELY